MYNNAMILQPCRHNKPQAQTCSTTNVRPRSFVLENVPDVLHAKHRPLLDAMLEPIKALRDSAGDRLYGIKMAILDTSKQGLPQSRRRLYVVGILAKDMV